MNSEETVERWGGRLKRPWVILAYVEFNDTVSKGGHHTARRKTCSQQTKPKKINLVKLSMMWDRLLNHWYQKKQDHL